MTTPLPPRRNSLAILSVLSANDRTRRPAAAPSKAQRHTPASPAEKRDHHCKGILDWLLSTFSPEFQAGFRARIEGMSPTEALIYFSDHMDDAVPPEEVRWVLDQQPATEPQALRPEGPLSRTPSGPSPLGVSAISPLPRPARTPRNP